MGSYKDPVSQVGFWREPLDITRNRAETGSGRRRRNRQLLQPLQISKIDLTQRYDDFNRARMVMKKGDVDVQRCSTRRMFSDAIKKNFLKPMSEINAMILSRAHR